MRKSTVFYFSGTGNSLYVAKKIAQKTDSKIVPITETRLQKTVKVESKDFILVFPIHYIWNGGLPELVKKFISKIENIKSLNIVAVSTCGGVQGDSLVKLHSLLQKMGGSLLAGYTVKFPYNYISFSGSLSKFSQKEIDDQIEKSESKIIKICEAIESDNFGIIERDFRIILSIVDFLNLREKLGKPHYQAYSKIHEKMNYPFTDILPLMDKSFYSNSKCNGCRMCKNICPVDNIEIKNNVPEWKHQCEQCFACFQWCPENAIEFGKNTVNGNRYHNPSIQVKEMMSGHK